MTKQEFITQHQRQESELNRRLGRWMMVLFVGILAMIPLGDRIEKSELNETWVKGVLVSVFVGLLAGLGALAWYVVRLQKRHSHHCPHCRKPFIGLAANIVIATGNCGDCGGKVFDDVKKE